MPDLILPPITDPFHYLALTEYGRGLVLYWDAYWDHQAGSKLAEHSYRRKTGDVTSAPLPIWDRQIGSLCYDLDGSTDMLYFPPLNLEMPFTIAVLCRLDSSTGGTLVGERDAGDYRFQFWYHSNALKIRIGNDSDAVSSLAVPTGTWAWCCISLQSASGMFVHKRLDTWATTTSSGSHNDVLTGAGDNPVTIFGRFDGFPSTAFLQEGRVAKVAIWKHAKTLDELESWFNQHRHGLRIPPRYLTYSASGGISLSPSAAAAIALGNSPSVIQGPISIAPSNAPGHAAAIDPQVRLGSLVTTPGAAPSTTAAPDPSVTLGSVQAAPAQAISVATAISPSVSSGGDITFTPAAAIVAAVAQDPIIVLSSLALTPAQSESIATAVSPSVDAGGGSSVTPAAASSLAQAQSPVVTLSSISLVPAVGQATGTAISPLVNVGGINVSPASATITSEAIDPTTVLGSIVLVPLPADAAALAIDPIVIASGMILVPGLEATVPTHRFHTTLTDEDRSVNGTLISNNMWHMTLGEKRHGAISLKGRLDSGELLTGTPTVTVSPAGPTISGAQVNTSTLTINDDTNVAAGEAVQLTIEGGSATLYELLIEVDTDKQQKLKVTQRLEIFP